MATAANSQSLPSEMEVEERRFAVESALGSLRMEGIELQGDALEAVEAFAAGRIDLDAMSQRIRSYRASLV